jgi:low temperature requirement protein LtrA
MKPTLRRFAFYFLFLAVSITVFQNWPKPPEQFSQNSTALYIGQWLGLLGSWIVLGVIFDTAYRLVRMYVFWEQRQSTIENAPTKELAVPETNKLDRK